MVSIFSDYTNFAVMDWRWWSHCVNEWIDEFPMGHYEKLPPAGLLILLTPEQQTRTKTLFLLTAFYKRRTIISKLTLQTRKRRTFLEGDTQISSDSLLDCCMLRIFRLHFCIRKQHMRHLLMYPAEHIRSGRGRRTRTSSGKGSCWRPQGPQRQQQQRQQCSHHCLLANVT